MSPPPRSLFRAEALAAERPRLAGRIVIARPIGLRVLSIAAVLLAAAVVAFAYFARYTQHVTVVGMLVPDRGVIEVRAAQAGRIVARLVAEGDAVTAGQPLFVISSERESALGPTGEDVRGALEHELESLEAQLAALAALEQNERRALEDSAAAAKTELAALRSMIAAQTERAGLAEATARRYARLRAQGFVSTEQHNAKHEQHLDEQARSKTLERELIAARGHRHELASQLESLPIRYRSERAELERAVAAARRARSEAEALRELIVTAPLDGTATAVLGDVGRAVDGNVVLASILPAGAELNAHLYIPSSAIGFVSVGDSISLRYRGYPYQRFGHHGGRIASISRTALSRRDLTGERLAGAELGPGPYYRIIAELGSQTVAVDGGHAPLRSGMLLDAELSQDTRRLYQWMLDPYRKLGL